MDRQSGRTPSPSSSRSSSSYHTIPGSPRISSPSLLRSVLMFSSSKPYSALLFGGPGATFQSISDVFPESISVVVPDSILGRQFRPPTLPWDFPLATSQWPSPCPYTFGQLSPDSPTRHDPDPDPTVDANTLPRAAREEGPRRLCIRCMNMFGGYELCRGNCPPLHVPDPTGWVLRTFGVDDESPAEEQRYEWLNMLGEEDTSNYWLQVAGRRYLYIRVILTEAGEPGLGFVDIS